MDRGAMFPKKPDPSAGIPLQLPSTTVPITAASHSTHTEGHGGHGILRHDIGSETECKRLFFSTLDSVIGEMNRRFSERNSQLVEALCALDPENPHFLDVQKVTPLLELTKTTLVESEFAVARNFLQSEMARSTGDAWTPTSILQRFSRPLAAMPTVLTALKHGVTFGASSATSLIEGTWLSVRS
ncbi:hypothetical protein NQZ68_001003 [Dissostichus eleginoides]|nr:hypothetical protein NQZ68_001003 [Dissostichus eleginoides]